MTTAGSPFHGWDMAQVGCHWSRTLPDGRLLALSSWSCGAASGYQLTLDYLSRRVPGVAAANAVYDHLARSAPGTLITTLPEELPASDPVEAQR